MTELLRIGSITITGTKRENIQEGETITGVATSGTAVVFELTADGLSHARVGDNEWKNIERDVRIIGEVKGNRAVRRLEHGLRMGVTVLDEERVWVELSQARVKRRGQTVWSNLKKASWSELDAGSGLDARDTLKNLGALETGTRRKILGPARARSNYLATIFDSDNHLGLVGSYVLTRVLPLIRGFSAAQMSLPLE